MEPNKLKANDWATALVVIVSIAAIVGWLLR